MTKLKTLSDLTSQPHKRLEFRKAAKEWLDVITSDVDLSKCSGWGIEYPSRIKHPRELYDIHVVNWIKHFFELE